MKIRKTPCILLSIFTLLVTNTLQAVEYQSDPKVEDLFVASKLEGTFVLLDENGNTTVHNPIRAQEQFVPASTFKVANSLIGLATGVVKSADEVFFHYDGKTPLFLKSWEKDMNLRQAIKASNVVAYQELARKIGLGTMQKYVSDFEYGNKNIGKIVDHFWLDGPLKISALEQAAFLMKLAKKQLPIKKSIQTAVIGIAQLDKGSTFTLYGKTGTSSSVVWFVGWVKKKGHLYSFALNIKPDPTLALEKRSKSAVELAKNLLLALGYIQ